MLFFSLKRGFRLFDGAVALQAEDVLVFSEEGAELLFVVAQLFLAVFAGHTFIGVFGRSSTNHNVFIIS